MGPTGHASAGNTDGAPASCRAKRRSRRFSAGPLRHLRQSTRAYRFEFVYRLYRLDRARRLTGPRGEYESQQLALCLAGRAWARGGHRLRRVVAGATLRTQTNRLIGWSFGDRVSRGAIRVVGGIPDPGPSVRGLVRVAPGGIVTGSPGSDEQLPRLEAFGANQVNAIWESRRGSSGSLKRHGNVAHTLWELPRRARPPRVEVDVAVRVCAARSDGYEIPAVLMGRYFRNPS